MQNKIWLQDFKDYHVNFIDHQNLKCLSIQNINFFLRYIYTSGMKVIYILFKWIISIQLDASINIINIHINKSFIESLCMSTYKYVLKYKLMIFQVKYL